MKPEAVDWTRKADGDWQVASREAQSPVYDAVCFHAQQCVEKYLKTWLVEQGIPVPQVHDLVVLLDRAGDTLPQLLHPQSASTFR